METEEVENNAWEERPEQHCEQGELLADHNSRDDEGDIEDRGEFNMVFCLNREFYYLKIGINGAYT